MFDLKGKRLLVLAGVNPIAADVVRFARKMGAYTIVTGNLDVTHTPAKRFADENCMVSTADLDALEELIHEKHVDGVLTGSSEYGIERVISLCERLDLPFYCTREQWDVCSNKERFKNLCREHDVPVIREFHVRETAEGLDCSELRYPVIVKPVDGSGGGGISVCENEEKFRAAYRRAMEYSHCKRVIIEEYLSGDEVGVSYAIQNGNVVLTAMHDRYLHAGEAGFMRLPQAYVYPSRYLSVYQKNQNAKVVEMFRSIGLQSGTLFIQGFADDRECPFYEMGYRFNGAKQYNILQDACGFNTMDMVINLALTGSMGDDVDITRLADPNFDHVYCTLSILARPGKVAQVVGLEELEELPESIEVSPWYYGGEEITENLIGTQRQIACRVTLKTKTREEMKEAIDKVYAVYDIRNEKGESLLMAGFDSSRILE